MFTIRFQLAVTAMDEETISRRFRAAWHVKTVVVKHAQKQLNKLERDRAYIDAKKEYASIKKQVDKLDENDPETALLNTQLEALTGIMNSRREYFGLTKADMESYAKGQGPSFAILLTSQQIQKLADQVWLGVEKVLFGNGKRLHIKKLSQLKTIPGKSMMNGVRFYDTGHTGYYKKSVSPRFPDGEIEWLGLQIRCRIDRRDPYIQEALKHDISYCTIERLWFDTKYRYYVILTMKGTAPKKISDPGTDTMGIDPGVSSIAAVSNHAVFLNELAPNTGDYEKEIRCLQRSIDRSLRISDPDNYNEDGTPKKGKHKIHPSKTCLRKMRRIRTLYRKQTAATETSHRTLINEMIREAGAGIVKVETMDYPALAKRSKQVARQDHESKVIKKDGTSKTVRKYKRRRRFGSSVRLRSPGKFISFLEQKVNQYGGHFYKTDTAKLKASQYNHDTDTYEKVPLSQRSKTINGIEVQRDLYSALIHKNAVIPKDKDTKPFEIDRRGIIEDFMHFTRMSDALLCFMKQDGLSMKQVFGF